MDMKYIASYALLVLGGNESPSADDVSKVLKSVGVDTDSGKLDTLISNLKGKKLNEVIAAGSSKFAAVAVGGGAAAAASSGAAAAAPVQEKEEEPQEEAADVGVGDIFAEDDY
mmetsp:Transcript_11067/g.12443  ORF Transcript_11067/g.12443 Transcript_11067/m.12443 type:complete len:113 (-) Transcript_11067:57-395(-)|eukprot:CAMPEP_0168335896 /NCGR_PEP_ID=MMETSP0213-20121227/11197_1 /TAXON_ID=151035 /ORGANISM="Euplotes harpa, Strain FSP1.4" /LENGTH=112 /DNA_ID=CAMNT_0008340941 /DNA_START=28 /DNA_END=366 /DNA_ORIENTATION=+